MPPAPSPHSKGGPVGTFQFYHEVPEAIGALAPLDGSQDAFRLGLCEEVGLILADWGPRFRHERRTKCLPTYGAIRPPVPDQRQLRTTSRDSRASHRTLPAWIVDSPGHATRVPRSRARGVATTATRFGSYRRPQPHKNPRPSRAPPSHLPRAGASPPMSRLVTEFLKGEFNTEFVLDQFPTTFISTAEEEKWDLPVGALAQGRVDAPIRAWIPPPR